MATDLLEDTIQEDEGAVGRSGSRHLRGLGPEGEEGTGYVAQAGGLEG